MYKPTWIVLAGVILSTVMAAEQSSIAVHRVPVATTNITLAASSRDILLKAYELPGCTTELSLAFQQIHVDYHTCRHHDHPHFVHCVEQNAGLLQKWLNSTFVWHHFLYTCLEKPIPTDLMTVKAYPQIVRQSDVLDTIKCFRNANLKLHQLPRRIADECTSTFKKCWYKHKETQREALDLGSSYALEYSRCLIHKEINAV
jgi:hypothetical protein